MDKCVVCMDRHHVNMHVDLCVCTGIIWTCVSRNHMGVS